MSKKIAAFFACSFLSVAMTIPAMAEEVIGTVTAIDEDESSLTLDDGTTYELPGGFDYGAVRPGMEVVVLCYESGPARADLA